MFIGIEAGGTKFNCIIAEDPENILAEKRIATTDPEQTMQETIQFIHQTVAPSSQKIQAVGIGSFGPLDLDPASLNFGSITSTPKTAWKHFNIKKAFEDALHLPVVLDTDVNAAAYGEFLWGTGKGKKHILYLTIGTGIGGGFVMDEKPYHGMLHPEMGHIFLADHLHNDPFKGICPYHGNCFEGLASGPALQSHWGIEASQLEKDHPAWEQEAQLIALALCNYICILSPDIIILGGGVMQQMQLFPLIQKKVPEILNGYVQAEMITRNIAAYIVPPGLGSKSGVLGALALARLAV
ncbi:MAG: ROK family protein [Anaerolineaceae bacterium]